MTEYIRGQSAVLQGAGLPRDLPRNDTYRSLKMIPHSIPTEPLSAFAIFEMMLDRGRRANNPGSHGPVQPTSTVL